MKGFISRHLKLIGFLGAVVLGLSMGVGVMAAYTSWQPTPMVSASGTITVVQAPGDFVYTLSPSTLNFGTIQGDTGATIRLTSNTITVTDDPGNLPIAGFNVTMTTPPSGVTNPTLRVYSTIDSDGSGGTFYVTLDVTLPATPGSVNLSSMVITFIPISN